MSCNMELPGILQLYSIAAVFNAVMFLQNCTQCEQSPLRRSSAKNDRSSGSARRLAPYADNPLPGAFHAFGYRSQQGVSRA